MEMIELKVETFYSAPKCDCGGFFETPVSDFYLTNPPQRAFLCNKCGYHKTVPEQYFPGVKSRIIDSMK
jgi:hypothetical protein